MPAPCPRCKHEQASVHYDFGAAKIVRCGGCSLLYLDPWPSAEDTAAVYGVDYFSNEKFLLGENEHLFGYVDYAAERFNQQPQYARIASLLRELLVCERRPPRLLEVGCGFGYFLDEAFEQGFAVTGLEFNEHAVRRLRQKYAFEIVSGALERAELPPGAFDAIAMFDVIEHLRDPFLSLDKLHHTLAPGGVLAVSTVDAESPTSRLIGSRLEDFRRTREHLFFFSRRTLREVLEEHGFDVLTIRSIGHTFELAFLLKRLALYHRPIFGGLERLARRLRMGSLQLRVNPGTKMIAIARRRETPRIPAPLRIRSASSEASVSPLDRTLIDELWTLDSALARHYQWIVDLMTPYLGASVLEVGSGVGVISKYLLSRCETLTLSEHKEVYLEEMRQRFGELPNLRYRLLDLARPPFAKDDEKVDTIVCLNVLEHIEDDRAAIEGLAELLPPGGRLIVQVPNHPWLFGSLDDAYGHFRRYRPRDLRASFERAGLRTVSLRRLSPVSIPGWLVSGKLARARRLNERSLRAYDAAVPVLRRLGPLSRITGISLLAVAEKRAEAGVVG